MFGVERSTKIPQKTHIDGTMILKGMLKEMNLRVGNLYIGFVEKTSKETSGLHCVTLRFTAVLFQLMIFCCVFRFRFVPTFRKKMLLPSSAQLNFRLHASSIQDRRFATLQRTLFNYLINKYTSLSDICLTVHH